MDKRLLKSLTTAKTRYENTIADAQAKLHVVNSMLESLIESGEEANAPATPTANGAENTQPKQEASAGTAEKPTVPGFIGRKHETATV